MAANRVKIGEKLAETRMKSTFKATESQTEKPFKSSVNYAGCVFFRVFFGVILLLCFFASLTEGLHLDGTKQTYVKYPKWQVRRRKRWVKGWGAHTGPEMVNIRS